MPGMSPAGPLRSGDAGKAVSFSLRRMSWHVLRRVYINITNSVQRMVADEASAEWRGGTSVLRGALEAAHPWRAGLPKRWLGKVVVPTYFVRYRDYEIRAERFVGYEYEEQPCFCEYQVDFLTPQRDGLVAPVVGISYWEHLKAWRLTAAQWLILRRYQTDRRTARGQAFFCLSENMPR